MKLPGMNLPVDAPPRKRRGRLLVILPLGLATVCALSALPWLENRLASMAAVLQDFKERTGLRLAVAHSHGQRFPSPRLTLKEPRRYDSASTMSLELAERVELAPPVSLPSFAIARSGVQRASCGGSNWYVEG